MQSTSCEMPGWLKHKLESRLPGETSIISDMQMTPPLWEKAKSLLMKVKEESEETGSAPITSWHIDGETMETVTDFILGGRWLTAVMKHSRW